MSATAHVGPTQSHPLFAGCYLLLDVVHGALSTLARPVPKAADGDVYRYPDPGNGGGGQRRCSAG